MSCLADRARRELVAKWPDFTIQIDDQTGHGRTFREVQRRLALGATALGAPVADGGLGLSGDSDEIIGLLGFNSLEYFDIVHSLLMITTPFALISVYSTRFELAHALKLTKATRLFVDAKVLDNVLAIIEDPDVHIKSEHIYILAGSPPNGWKSFSHMIDAVEHRNVPLVPVRPATKDTLAYLIMSSGTSGLPKAVMTTHGNVICSILQGVAIAESTHEKSQPHTMPVTIAVLPMFHSYGLHAYILRATLYRATYVIMQKWDTTRYLECIPKHAAVVLPLLLGANTRQFRYRVTQLSLIPSTIHQLVNHPLIKTTDFSSIIYINSGAAYLPPELAAQLSKFLRKSSVLTQSYGLSETTLTALARPSADTGLGSPPPTATGVLIPGLEARIVRADGSDAAAGETGELWLRGGNVVPGYWNNAQATADAFVNGFADRGKDTLKVSGVQVSPMEIEDVLLAHPAKLISDATVAGVSGGRTADEKVPRAWVVLSAAGKAQGASAVIEALEAWYKESLSKYKWLRGGIEVVDELPKTATGKTMRRVLQDEYERRVKAKL
ncbi:hypothetical protein MSAN_01485700 [Mycena sanguinolenta]|uniref:Acetyl-CoA synthetase-like protein n=1 Tax=Mycena sanguinolenta TaxID=230812 RepID=A0A8H6YB00_9AGAR|nr:hypothetical protein MSAN_01485700 [Mycena sanguinolenta]